MSDTKTPYNYDLWQHMHEQHGLTLLDSELSDIEDTCQKVRDFKRREHDIVREAGDNDVVAVIRDLRSQLQPLWLCAWCRGSGKHNGTAFTCRHCGGSGIYYANDEVER